MKFLFFIVLAGLLLVLIALGFAASRMLRNRVEAGSRRRGYVMLGCFSVTAVTACLVAALGACCWLPGAFCRRSSASRSSLAPPLRQCLALPRPRWLSLCLSSPILGLRSSSPQHDPRRAAGSGAAG